MALRMDARAFDLSSLGLVRSLYTCTATASVTTVIECILPVPNRAFYYGQEEIDCELVVDQERRKLAATLPERVE
eukprot:471887-Pleurochrysis_carterae.AAC.1